MMKMIPNKSADHGGLHGGLITVHHGKEGGGRESRWRVDVKGGVGGEVRREDEAKGTHMTLGSKTNALCYILAAQLYEQFSETSQINSPK